MANLIVLTGNECTLKSTFTSELNNNLNGIYTHFDKPKDMLDGKRQYFDFLKNLNNTQPYICDRYWEGELVYAPRFRGYSINYMNELENEIVKDNNILYVHMKANLETILYRASVRGEDFVKPQQFNDISQLFNQFILKQHLPFIEIDTSCKNDEKINVEDNLKIILESYEKLNKIWDSLRGCSKCNITTTPLALPRGNINAKYFVVGQNPGGRGKEKNQYVPIFSAGNTSQFLIDTLINAGIYKDSWLTNLVLCGTCDNKINKNLVDNCQYNLKLQYDLIKPEKIFALGNETYKYLKENFENNLQDCEIILVEHPTYIKRFFSGKVDKLNEYMEKFKV